MWNNSREIREIFNARYDKKKLFETSTICLKANLKFLSFAVLELI